MNKTGLKERLALWWDRRSTGEQLLLGIFPGIPLCLLAVVVLGLAVIAVVLKDIIADFLHDCDIP